MGALAVQPRRRRRLRARLSVVVIVYLVLFLASSVVAARTVRSWNRSVEERTELRLMGTDVADLRLALSDQERSVNGFMRSSDATLLEPYRDALRRETSVLTRIEDRVEDREDRLRAVPDHLDAVRAAAGAWRSDAVEPLIERKQRAVDDDPALIELGTVRFEEVRSALEDLALLVAAETDAAADRVSGFRRNAVAGMVTAFSAAFACTVLAIWLFHRWITKPLAEMSTAARAIAAGQVGTMPTFDTAEFGDVADAIDSMQRSLSDERDRAIRAFEGLEQSAVLALQVRSELAEERAVAPVGWGLATRLRAAEGFVAGDCYETGLIDQNTMYIVVIDVTGHGATAALSALRAKAQLRSALRAGLSPGMALGWLAREHHDDAGDDFVTAFVAVVDVASGECHWANAGHPPALVVADGTAVELSHSGPLIGPFDSAWSTETIVIPPSGVLLAYTDGLTEARGGDRSRLGEDRLHECVESSVSEAGGPEEIIESLIRLIDEFQVGPATDDVTIVALTRSGGGDDRTRDASGDASGDATGDAAGGADPPENDARSPSASSLGAR